MRRNYIYVLVFVLLVLPLFKAEGQTLKVITEKFQKYCSELPREEVYIHTDRDDYIAGEELWFSSIVLDRQTGKPDSNSSILYVEVLNSENNPVGQKRILVANGFGPGEITLPDTLATGCYTLRAYTNWMKNFLPYNCFVKKIQIYNALNTATGISCRAVMPASSKDQGNASTSSFSFSVVNHKGKDAELSIISSDRFRSQNNSLCYIFIETHGNINYKGVVNLSSGSTSFIVPSGSLTAGINHITFFDSNGKPLSEKFIYTREPANSLLSVTAPESCRRREKVTLEIDLNGQLPDAADSCNLSISVTAVGNKEFNDIRDYLVFGSEFGILPDEISGMNPDEIPAATLENFLSTAKSNWIDWDQILSENVGSITGLPEKDSHFLSGRLFNRNTHSPVPDKIVFLSIPGKNASFQYSVTDRMGIFKFIIPLSESGQDLIIQPEENDKSNSIEILSSFADSYPEGGYTATVPDKSLPTVISKWSANYQVNRIYGIGYTSAREGATGTQREIKRFYGKPDIELILDDYIKLPVMSEVFYELLPGVSMKSRKNTYEVSIIDPVDGKFQKRPPVLFIDGVIINDANVIAGLDPEIVERIDVVKEKYFVGDYIFYGLINVVTRAGDFSCTALPEQALRLSYREIDPELTFREPEFSEPGKGLSNIPDFRNTLYWNPIVRFGKYGRSSVSFRTSDLDGEYEINIQGLTFGGKPLSVRKTFRVK